MNMMMVQRKNSSGTKSQYANLSGIDNRNLNVSSSTNTDMHSMLGNNESRSGSATKTAATAKLGQRRVGGGGGHRPNKALKQLQL